MIHVALVDQSTVATNGELEVLAQALTLQCRHLAEAGWPVAAEVHAHRPGSAPKGAWQLILRDDTDEPGAAGWHDHKADGTPVGFAFVRTAQQAGLLWTVTASHELVEILADALAVFGADLGRDQDGAAWWVAAEVADPVEADSDGYNIAVHGREVRVSDFVTRNWFLDGAPGPYDWCGHLDSPLTLRPGGYASVQVDGEWSQVVAEEKSPDGKSRAEFSHRVFRRAGEDLVQRRTVAADHLLQVKRA